MAVAGRGKYPRERFRFGTDGAGRPVVYTPHELIVKSRSGRRTVAELTQDLDGMFGVSVPETAAAAAPADKTSDAGASADVTSDAGASAAEASNPGFRVSGEVLPDGWQVVVRPEAISGGFDPIEVIDRLRSDGVDDDFDVQPNHIYFVDSIGANASFAPNQFAPNQFAPNQFAPNQFAPNQFAPNQFAPNQFAPNQFAPNQFAPNQFAPNQFAPMMYGRGSDCCTCPTPPGFEDEPPYVAELTARRAYGPPPVATPSGAKGDLPTDDDLEIHVLDVRQVVTNNMGALAQAKGIFNTPDGGTGAQETALAGVETIPGAVIPRAQDVMRAAADANGPAKDAVWEAFEQEPASPGQGTNTNNDSYVDPVCGHTEFIVGIIGRIVDEKMVTRHAIAGTLGDISDTDLVKALEYVHVNHAPENGKDLRILSLSLSGYNENDEMQPAPCLAQQIKKMVDAGWLIVASAGNNASCRLAWPAALPGVIAVGAYGQSGPAWFSNYGPWVDACAPGVHVVSDYPKLGALGVTDQNGDALKVTGDVTAAHFDTGYAAWSGTSFSAPFVAAQLAAWMIQNPMASRDETYEAALDSVIHDPDLSRLPNLGTVVEYRKEING